MTYTVYLDYEDELQSAEPSAFFTDLETAMFHRDAVWEQATREKWNGLRSVFLVVGERKYLD